MSLPISVRKSDSSIEESTTESPYESHLENLKKLPVPYSDIYHVLTSYDTIPIDILSSRFRKAASDLTVWLETAKLAVLDLKVEAQQKSANGKQDVSEIDMIMNRFHPNIEMMVELRDKVGPRLETSDTTQEQQLRGKNEAEEPALTGQELQHTTKTIQYGWGALKTMLDEVKGIFASAQTRRELLTQMENVLAEVENIELTMDRLQDERSRHVQGSSTTAEMPSSPPYSLSTSPLDTGVTSLEETQGRQQRSTDALADIDSQIESLTPRIGALTSQLDALTSKDPTQDELQDQYRELLGLWDDAKARREKIGDELKEERWLAVFEQVAGQVESMMESMDRAIVHCKGLVDQIKAMVREKVVPTAPIDRDHLYTIFKSFEAKHKYYAPAVNKMLNMLENGIDSRTTKNTEILQKHRIMKTKWDQLRDSLDQVELDLDSIEEMLDILDASIPSHIPTPPAQLPERPLFAMRRSRTQSEWRSPEPPALFQPPQQAQQVQPVQQRGRRPLPLTSSLQSPAGSPNESLRARNRSPMNTQRHRPWSPVPSITSLPSMLSPNTYVNYRSLSRSPSRSPSRQTSDKPRPWCPSTKTTSPSIPGIPHSPSAAATYAPRSRSSSRQEYDPDPSRPPLSRSASSMSRTRSTSCTPSLNGGPSQLKPVFSPVGSMSKLSAGAQTARSTSPTPGSAASGRKSQLKLPPPVVTNSLTRSRQNSAPTPTSATLATTMSQRRSSSPIPYGREAPSGQRQSMFSPPPTVRQRQSSAQNVGDGIQNLQRNRRTSLDNHGRLQTSRTTTTAAASGGYFAERVGSVYGPGPGSTTGSSSSMGLETCPVPPFEEPASPSTSSSSSVGSFSRLQPSRFQQLQEQQQHQHQQQQHQQQQHQQQQHQQQQQEQSKKAQNKSELPDLLEKVRVQERPSASYVSVRGDELDEEFARILNASPIQMQVRRLGEGKYYFGGRVEERAHGRIVALGGKMVLCRLMEYGRSSSQAADDSQTSSGRSLSGVEEALYKQQQQQQQGMNTLRRPEPAASRSTRMRARSFNSPVSSSSSAPAAKAGSGKKRKVMVRVGGGWQDLDIFLLDHCSLADDAATLRVGH
ncbi:hypothetical protein BGZ54_000658 [Gamsiella multidivaricata]|nr:hypothetical protein BGZ54_000658 [Gamsiella multidivaricata]